MPGIPRPPREPLRPEFEDEDDRPYLWLAFLLLLAVVGLAVLATWLMGAL